MRAKSEHSGPPNTRFVEIRHVAQTGSTNQDLLAEASLGAAEGLVLVADHQSAGRGRQGRTWLDGGAEMLDEMSVSSLLVSWLLRPGLHMRGNITIVPLLTGLAVADALHQLCGLRVGVKWPNDLLSVPASGKVADERKLAGILVQGSTTGGDTALVVGLGLNLRSTASRQLHGVATDLQTLLSEQQHAESQLSDTPPSRFEVLNGVLASVEKLYQRLEEDGPESILGLYRERCVTLGRQVEMRTPGGIVMGSAVDIDSGGGLIVETDVGPEVVTAGDAHHIGSHPGPA